MITEKDFEQKKKRYLEKLQRIIRGIEQINQYENRGVIRPDQISSLNDKKAKAEKLFKKLENNEFEIAVVGLEKVGKSSFSNAFIDANILPTKDERCTYTSTCIKYGTEQKARIVFYTAAEFIKDFQDKLAKLGIENANTYLFDRITLSEYEALYSKVSDENKSHYKNFLHQDIKDIISNQRNIHNLLGREDRIFTNDDVESEECKRFIIEPAYALAVREIHIESDKLGEMKHAILYDVPGFNSPTALHKEQTIEKMKQADAIIMVAKADEPSLTGENLEIFKDNFEEGGISFGEKLFVFANKADRATNFEENKSTIIKEWTVRREILDKNFADRIILGSANAALGKKVEGGLKAREAMHEIGQKYGIDTRGQKYGIDTLRGKLLEYYQDQRMEMLAKRVDSMILEMEEMLASIKKEYKISETTSIEEISDISITIYTDAVDTIVKQLEHLKDKINREEGEEELSKALRNQIQEMVQVEKYGITDEEMENVHIRKAGNGRAEQPIAVESEIRDLKFNTMYDDFGNVVYTIAENKYAKVSDEIQNIFMEVFHITPSTPKYEMVKKDLEELIGRNFLEVEESFQILIDRFSRDIFEILIKKSRGQDRYNKFEERMENFLSLGVYYSASKVSCEMAEADLDDSKTSGESVQLQESYAYLKLAPRDSEMWKILLWPELLGFDTEKENAWKTLMDLTGIKRNKTIEKALDRFVCVNDNQTVERLKKMFEKYILERPEFEIVKDVKEILLDSMDDGAEEQEQDYQLENILSAKKRRVRRCYFSNNAFEEHSYNGIRKEFDADINALQNVLQYAFVRAVNLDRAFSAKAVKRIEQLVNLIKRKGKDNPLKVFINKNLANIESSKIQGITEKEERARTESVILGEIEDILEKIKAQ